MKKEKIIEKQEIKTLMPNHIQDYLVSVEGNKQQFHSRELFKAEALDIDLKTEINDKEITQINALKWNNQFLESKGLKPIFQPVIDNFMRLKVSKERGARKEFVEVNKGASLPDENSPLSKNLSNMGSNIRK